MSQNLGEPLYLNTMLITWYGKTQAFSYLKTQFYLSLNSTMENVCFKHIYNTYKSLPFFVL